MVGAQVNLALMPVVLEQAINLALLEGFDDVCLGFFLIYALKGLVNSDGDLVAFLHLIGDDLELLGEKRAGMFRIDAILTLDDHIILIFSAGGLHEFEVVTYFKRYFEKCRLEVGHRGQRV